MVHFDFQNDELPPEKWDCPSIIWEGRSEHPGWYFASDISSSVPTLAGSTFGEIAVDSIARATENGKIVVCAGDRVRAESVEWLTRATDPLEPEVDQEVARLNLIVERISGGSSPGGSVVVYRKGAMRPGFGEIGTLQTLADRVDQLSLESEATAEVRQLLERVQKRVERHEDDARLLRQKVGEQASLANFGGLDITRLANIAALLGYRIGRAEANENMAPMARTGHGRTLQAREAGQEGGRRHRDTERDKFALEYWNQFPKANINELLVQWRQRHPNDVSYESSIRRSFEGVCPSTSSSYEAAQAAIAKRRATNARRKAATRLEANRPTVGI